jgi:hypothetical protein
MTIAVLHQTNNIRVLAADRNDLALGGIENHPNIVLNSPQLVRYCHQISKKSFGAKKINYKYRPKLIIKKKVPKPRAIEVNKPIANSIPKFFFPDFI